MPWFDIGANLTNKRFSDDLPDVIQRASEHGVQRIMVTGTNLQESRRAIELCELYPNLLCCTVGIHPHDADEAEPDFVEQLRQMAAHSSVVAIGECGLDFNRLFSSEDNQLTVFEQQLALAVDLQLPVFLHERDAFDQQVTILKRYSEQLSGGVAHCFTGPTQQALTYMELGFYIGVTGWVCDEKRATDLRQAIPHIPLSKLMLETDAPYLTPKSLGKKVRRNEPCHIHLVAKTINQITGATEQEIALQSFANATSLFTREVHG